MGADATPEEWRQKLVRSDRIASLARCLFAAGGGEAHAAWAADELVHAGWVEPGRLLAGEYPGHPDPSRTRDKLDVLVDAGVRTYVDLTTTADRLAPYDDVLRIAATDRDLDLRRISFPDPRSRKVFLAVAHRSTVPAALPA